MMRGEAQEKAEARYRTLTKTLISRGLTITTMESITGGLIASFLTDTEGSSAVFPGGFITYANESKVAQGVPADVIARYSVYSRETAEAMAAACKAAYATDIGIGVTGNAGNIDPANPEDSSPGTVYYAICREGGTVSYAATIPASLERHAFKCEVAVCVADTLLTMLREEA